MHAKQGDGHLQTRRQAPGDPDLLTACLGLAVSRTLRKHVLVAEVTASVGCVDSPGKLTQTASSQQAQCLFK